jgi:hypothetical protein
MENIELKSPSVISASARAAEITTILAAAIIRTQLSQATEQRQFGLGFLPDQRVHTTPYPQEKL